MKDSFLDIKKMAPCYIYEEDVIRSACKDLKSVFKDFKLIYSVKANPFSQILNIVREEGFGADVVSPAEINKSLMAGMKTDCIYYSAPGKSEDDIKKALGKSLIIADSINELSLLDKAAGDMGEILEIGIRVNPNFAMGKGNPAPSKFGIDLCYITELKETIGECLNLEVVGIHVHLKSQVLAEDTIGKYYMDVFEMALDLQMELGIHIKFINFGSGIGIPYDAQNDNEIDLDKVKRFADMISARNQKTLKAELIAETGRFIVYRAGKYYTNIVDIKESKGKKYLIVQNGLNGFMRPSIADLVKTLAGNEAEFSMEPLFTKVNEFEVRMININDENSDCENLSLTKVNLEKESDFEEVDVVGNLCTTMDVIKSEVMLKKGRIGDLIEITNAGSYGYSLSPVNFSGQDKPGKYLLTTDGVYVRDE